MFLLIGSAILALIIIGCVASDVAYGTRCMSKAPFIIGMFVMGYLITGPFFDGVNVVDRWLLGEKDQARTEPVKSTKPSPKPAESIHIDWNLILIIGASVVAFLLMVAVIYFLYSRWKAGEPSRKDKAERRFATKTVREENQKIWGNILHEGEYLVNRWADLSTDVENILARPLYARVDNPLTSKAISAVTAVRMERRDSLLDPDQDPWSTPYGMAVRGLRDDLRTLESRAQFYHLNSFSVSELKLLDQAQNLLSTARNTSSVPNERQMAYARLEKIFTTLNLSLSEETKECFELETQTVKQLTTAGKV